MSFVGVEDEFATSATTPPKQENVVTDDEWKNTDGVGQDGAGDIKTDSEGGDPAPFETILKIGGQDVKVTGKDTAEFAANVAKAYETAAAPKQKVQPETGKDSAFSPRALTADEKFAISRKITEDPEAAINELFEKRYGIKTDDIAANIVQTREAVRQSAEANAFIEAHPDDYADTPGNGKMLRDFLAANGYKLTKRNLEYAHQELSDKLYKRPAAGKIEDDNGQAAGTRQPQNTSLRRGNSSAPVRQENATSQKAEEEVRKLRSMSSAEQVRYLNALAAKGR